jgi:Secretion system C-terminal sorting domain
MVLLMCTDTFKAKITSTGTATGFGLGADTIKYTITDPKGCTATAKFPLTIANAFPSAVVLPSGTAPLCNNTPVVIYVVASTASGYQWLSGSTPIPGATAVSYSANTAGTYNLELTASGCVATFPGTTVLPKIVPTITFTPPNTLSTGTFTTYEWYKDGHFIPGATAATLTVKEGGNYKVVVLDANRCIDTSAVYKLAGVSGVQQLVSADEIRIYPNPASSVVSIDAPVLFNASVMSMDGKVLIRRSLAKEINVSTLANGMYMIMLYNERGQLLKAAKFVKESW